MLQLSGKKKRVPAASNLAELHRNEHGVLEHIDLPEDEARRMMELGFLPGTSVSAAHCAPGGDPRVYRVDGSEFALREETAARIRLRTLQSPDSV
jgi:ferrous iron transport protein A